jgi:hypothetical protein
MSNRDRSVLNIDDFVIHNPVDIDPNNNCIGDIDTITYDFASRVAVKFETGGTNLTGFDTNQDLVGLFHEIFVQALEDSVKQLKLTLDDSDAFESREPVDVSFRILDSDISEVDQ